MNDFSIERIPIPESLEGPGGSDFVASVGVRNASEARAYGTREVEYPAAELLPAWHDPQAPKALWIARLNGRIVGRAVHESQRNEDGSFAEAGWPDVDVHPEAEGLGIGTALADTAEDYARQLGQTRLIAYAVSPPASGEQLRSPTGFGSVAARNREVRFLLARGYRLEQVERASRFALPGDAERLAALRVEAESAAGGQLDASPYIVHQWAGLTPEAWLPDLATLLTRMSTDAPTAGLDEPEDVWSAARVAAAEARAAAGSRATLTSAVEHRATGRLVAFSQLSVPYDRTRPVSQEDTLVLREHRGHRLGMLVKVANLQFLEQQHPGHPSVLTWNAEENRPMLDVNEAAGFVPLGYEGAWRLDL